MSADRADLGGLRAVLEVAAVAAIPDLDARALEDLVVLEVLGELHIALFVGLFDLGDSRELVGQSNEALFLCGLGHFLVHLGPFEVLTLSRRDEVLRRGANAVQRLEPELCMLSLSGHKFHGPKGVGALYVRKGIILNNLIEGGAQERGKRAGTENLPGIVGMAAALQEAVDRMDENAKKVAALRDKLIDGALKMPETILNGDRVKRLPGNVNISVKGIEGESLLMRWTSLVPS